MQTLWSTTPHSTPHGLVCPCDGFRGWKQISVRGKIASKSYGDLRNLKMGWGWDSDYEPKHEAATESKIEAEAAVEEVAVGIAGKSPIEMLPAELLGKRFHLVKKLHQQDYWTHIYHTNTPSRPDQLQGIDPQDTGDDVVT